MPSFISNVVLHDLNGVVRFTNIFVVTTVS